jgi:5-methyltetrahydropteroyltriglutamate--homocysteine methyltransferase
MHNTDRIRTTHVGSLSRPEELQAFLRAIENGEAYDTGSFEQLLRSSVADVVAHQKDIGIDIVSDGEFGKTYTWAWYIRDRLNGFQERAIEDVTVVGPRHSARMSHDRTVFAEYYADYYARNPIAAGVRERGEAVCVGPISYAGLDAVNRDIEDLKAAMEQAGVSEGFLPVVAPSSAVPVRVDEFYASDEDFMFAVADALNVEYRAITDAGLSIQVDDAFLASMYDTMFEPGGSMKEYREWAELGVEAAKRALKGIPQEQTRYHVCWGSWNGPHSNDVPLAEIVDLILQVPVGAYSLEQAGARHEHEWEVWRDTKLPDDRVLMPGLVSHHTNVLEHPELVSQRIVRLAELVGRERVIASTDCGFAQTPYLTRVHPTIMWAKLAALVEGAHLASKKLWG